jgi:hypothetical protein
MRTWRGISLPWLCPTGIPKLSALSKLGRFAVSKLALKLNGYPKELMLPGI